MRASFIRYTLPLVTLLFTLTITSANNSIQVLFKSGTVKVQKQSSEEQIQALNLLKGNYCLISFENLPNESAKEALKSLGIELYEYIPKQSFYAYVAKKTTLNSISDKSIFSINAIPSASKIHPLITKGIPEWALINNKAQLILSYLGDHTTSEWESILKKYGAQIEHHSIETKRVFISVNKIATLQLADIESVFFIESIDPPGEPENFEGRTQHRSNMLDQDFSNGLQYDGTGVSIAMYDDGYIGPHIDYEGRNTQFTVDYTGEHGDHVSGTIMGAGNLDPEAKGMAMGAHLYVYNYNGNSSTGYDSVPSHYNKYGVNIISTSYSNGCNAGYTSFARKLDQHTNTLPSLIYVFSAGNNGTSNCNYGAGAGWGNITGGHKVGKNVIATGNLASSDALSTSSSRGPAHDGRIKPDICAKGTSVFSAMSDNNYRTISGTSMACPGIAGTIGQLYHAYKELNSNQNPPSGLIKGIVLNTADDLGNPGPDFKHGWGRINARKALEILNNNQYITGTISSSNVTHNLNVPSGVKEIRIMTYWHDYEALASASRALVNNIDMIVVDPLSDTTLPWVLNPAPVAATLNANAVRAIDTLNNMEQVTLQNPTAGNYSVILQPTSIPQGPQQYHVIYEYIYDEVVLTYPNGGEGLVPWESTIIRWDANSSTSTFDLEYTTDGGSTWNTITSSVAGSVRQINWTTPNVTSDSVRVRISRGTLSDESDANFNIIRVPANLNIDWVCPDSVQLSWNNTVGATGYRAYMLGQKYMDSVGSSATNKFVFKNTKPTKQYWVSVSANPSIGITGRRAVAIQTTAGTFNCPLTDDASVSSFTSPNFGTYLSCITDSVDLKVYVKNEGLNPIQNFGVTCTVSPSATYNETVTSTLQSGDSILVEFSPKIVPLLQLANVNCYTTLSSDQNKWNDTNSVSFAYINSNIETAPWEEDFEDFLQCGSLNNCEATICKLHNNWHNDSSSVIDDIDWRTDNAGTPSGNTGPSSDHKPGQPWGMYLYTEASISSSEACTYRTAQMLSPCFDLTSMSMPRFTFWYHRFGQYMGDLHVDLLTKDGYIEDIIPVKTGNHGDVWLKDSIDLTAFAGQIVSVRFRGITGAWLTSDMALDDMELFETDPFFGISDATLHKSFKLYPNPSESVFYLEWNEEFDGNMNLEISDITGKMVDFTTISRESNRYKIDLGNYDKGIYFLKISANGESLTRKLVKF